MRGVNPIISFQYLESKKCCVTTVPLPSSHKYMLFIFMSLISVSALLTTIYFSFFFFFVHSGGLFLIDYYYYCQGCCIGLFSEWFEVFRKTSSWFLENKQKKSINLQSNWCVFQVTDLLRHFVHLFQSLVIYCSKVSTHSILVK